MIHKTRIFISSAYEEELKRPRKIIKEHLEASGYEVPIFEDGDFGTWEKDTLQQCRDVVKSCDIFILLINKKASASSYLMNGNVTPTFLEYTEAINQGKHILVFVNPEVKREYMDMKYDFNDVYNAYLQDYPRIPSSPFDPLQQWVEDKLKVSSMYQRKLRVADPFVWAFLHDIDRSKIWFYDYDIAESREQAKIISDMLSTSFRSVVKFLPIRDKFEELDATSKYLMDYVDFSIDMLEARNEMNNIPQEDWSNCLKIATEFLGKRPIKLIQAPDFNPTLVNTILTQAATLYAYDGKDGLNLIGQTGDITADSYFKIDQTDIFVVQAHTTKQRYVAYREDKQCLYIAEPIGDTVLCLHFHLTTHWTNNVAQAYFDDLEYAIIDANEDFFDFVKLVIGGRS